MTIKKLTPFLFLAFTMNVNAQLDKNFKGTFLEADFNYLTQDYQKALNLFENLLDVDPNNSNLNFLCGDCCLRLGGNPKKSISYLKKAVRDVNPSYRSGSYKESQAPPEAYLLLARAYHINNEFSKAINIYEIYRDETDLKKFSEIEFVNRQIKSSELAMSMVASPLKVKFQTVLKDESQKYSRSNPVISGNDSIMIYVVNDPFNKAIKMITRQGNDWSKPRRLNIQLGVTGNFNPVSLSYDGTELYLVQQDYYDSQIFVSQYTNNRWTKVEELNKNINTRYSETHASVSRDGNTLFFTSDRKGGHGGLDIYRSERDSEGNWGEPINLGPSINTIYNEKTPFITKNDSKLYFSSEGHHTMGGYDIFYSARNQAETWSSPENLGYPVNTTGDDLFYNPGWNDLNGYYAWGVQDQTMKDIKTIWILPSEELTAGMSEQRVEEMEENDVITEAPGIVIQDTETGSSSDGEYLTLNSILFDFNDYKLNQAAIREVERIYTLMRELPEISIELTGHTDSRGSVESNMRISKQRAQSVAQFLIEKGIAPERIAVLGSGELSPIAINEYADGSDAPKGRLLNRHTSIKINNLPDDRVRVADMLVPDRLRPVQDRIYSVLLTENDQIINKMPKEFFGKQVSLVKTERAYLYIAERFERKADAVRYLNEAIDYGFPEARILEQEELESLISGRLQGDQVAMYAFTIQIIALKKSRDVSYFRELGVVMKYAGKDEINRYTFGKYRSNEEAKDDLSYIRQKGYRDAFIISTDRFEKMSGQSGPSAVVARNQNN